MNMKFATLADMLVAVGDEFRNKELMEDVMNTYRNIVMEEMSHVGLFEERGYSSDRNTLLVDVNGGIVLELGQRLSIKLLIGMSTWKLCTDINCGMDCHGWSEEITRNKLKDEFDFKLCDYLRNVLDNYDKSKKNTVPRKLKVTTLNASEIGKINTVEAAMMEIQGACRFAKENHQISINYDVSKLSDFDKTCLELELLNQGYGYDKFFTAKNEIHVIWDPKGEQTAKRNRRCSK